MAGLELATLAARPKAWADKLSNQNKVDRPLKTFVNTGSLTELAEGVANLNAARLTPQKKRTFADSSDDEKKQACGNESGEESASGCSQPAGPVSEESCSEDKRSKKKRKEKSKDERKRDKAILTLEDEEEEALDEEGGAPDVRLSWPAADVNFFAKELEGMMTKQDKKKERLPLSALVALLDNVPEDVLRANNLFDAHHTLKQMSRLPKKEKLTIIFDLMAGMVAKARSLQAEQDSENKGHDVDGVDCEKDNRDEKDGEAAQNTLPNDGEE